MLIVQRYGIEQEYTLLQTSVKWPLGWPVGGYPGPQVMQLLLCSISLEFIYELQKCGFN
jgi:hypothetical protein